MNCSNCGTENKPGRKFCVRCGTALAGVCPSCGATYDPGDQELFQTDPNWRDLIPSKRNTAAWGLLPHRRPRDRRE